MNARPRAIRADELLVQLELADDAAQAQALLMTGKVIASLPGGEERRVEKAGDRLPAGTVLRLRGKSHPYVSRGGLKLEHGLDTFGLSAKGLVAADIGVSTGGFTDCLLQRGALRVYAVEVGHNQTAWRIRIDPRVRLFERTHAASLSPEFFGELVDLLVVDLSFIALARVIEALARQVRPGGHVLALVKPQFELDKHEVEEGGVVRDEGLRVQALQRAQNAAMNAGLRPLDAVVSPVPGRDGNLEWLALFLREPQGTPA